MTSNLEQLKKKRGKESHYERYLKYNLAYAKKKYEELKADPVKLRQRRDYDSKKTLKYYHQHKHNGKAFARDKVRKAVRAGKLVIPKHCTACKKILKLEAHHPDYSKPLKVKWLCRKCHVLIHHKYEQT